jgi:hypothetical protein
MKYGLSFFPTDFTIRLDDLARAAEAHGFDSLLIAEHTHIPTSRLTVPATGMRDLPPQYSHTLDPFVALATAASATKTLKLGTGVCLVIERDPIIMAKEIASLDLLSGGRFIFGVGAGWNVEEMANHGTEFKSRRRLMRERIEAMKAIWTQEEPAYHGRFVNFDSIWCYPKPVQKPFRQSSWAGRHRLRCGPPSPIATAGCRLCAARPFSPNLANSASCWPSPAANRRPLRSAPTMSRSASSTRIAARWPGLPKRASIMFQAGFHRRAGTKYWRTSRSGRS